MFPRIILNVGLVFKKVFPSRSPASAPLYASFPGSRLKCTGTGSSNRSDAQIGHSASLFISQLHAKKSVSAVQLGFCCQTAQLVGVHRMNPPKGGKVLWISSSGKESSLSVYGYQDAASSPCNVWHLFSIS